MITETSGFNYLGTDCGYKWRPSEERGLAKGTSLGKAIAVVIDQSVVACFATYPPLWDAMRDGQLVDVTSQHSVPEGDAVIDISVNASVAYTLHVSNELLAAALTSSPVLAEITWETPAVDVGWRYFDGKFHEPN